jgi:hypothetical protein
MYVIICTKRFIEIVSIYILKLHIKLYIKLYKEIHCNSFNIYFKITY